MENYNTDWDKRDLIAYLMLYCADADFVETEDEKDLIKSKVGQEEYKHIHKEIDKDNDYVRIQKITQAAERLNLPKDKMESVLKEIQELFTDGDESDVMEQNLFRGLKRLFG